MTCLSAYMYRQISKCTNKTPKKHYWGGGGQSPLATLMLFRVHFIGWWTRVGIAHLRVSDPPPPDFVRLLPDPDNCSPTHNYVQTFCDVLDDGQRLPSSLKHARKWQWRHRFTWQPVEQCNISWILSEWKKGKSRKESKKERKQRN